MSFQSGTCNGLNVPMVTLDSVSDYIRTQWDGSVRCNVDRPNVVAVPLPHTVPSPAGKFHVMFYWDTYFSNVGLLLSDRIDLARQNCDALLWWVDQIGFVPNSAFQGDMNRSQPPMLSQMVREVYETNPDREWLAGAVPRLEREYDFWIKRRSFPGGLAHHGHDADDTYLAQFYDRLLRRRLGVGDDLSREAKVLFASQMLAEAESGQDFNPVVNHRALDFASVELNTLLFLCESNLAYFCGEIGLSRDKVATWKERASQRAAQIRQLLWDDADGLFRSRDMVWQQLSSVAHLGTFFPLWAGLATEEQARRVRDNLPRFERDFGVAQTEPYGGRTYQWAFPVGWPPTHWLTVRGLQRYGFMDDAVRIARKYCELQRRLFAEFGNLWEKFDVTTGRPGGGEYEADPMLGWTAGVFLGMRDVVEHAAVVSS